MNQAQIKAEEILNGNDSPYIKIGMLLFLAHSNNIINTEQVAKFDAELLKLLNNKP